MPKKKKTRKQKIIADMRHKVAAERPEIEYKPQPSADMGQPQLDRVQHSSTQTIDASRYQYLNSDLLKTVILTFSIIAGELVLNYLFF